MKQNKVIQLSEIEHVLKRSARYLGAINKTKVERFYLKDTKIQFGFVEYVPALLKLIREVLDNSIDEAIRTNFKYANKIKIKISNKQITIEDNGRGIPVVEAEDSKGNKLDKTMPELAWTELRAGSNFDDEDDNATAGQNGEGASLTNIWSNKFIGETCDGTNYIKVHCTNNLSNIETSTKKMKKQFTRVTFEPDLKRLGIETIDEVYVDLLEFDLMFIRETFKQIKFEIVRV